MEDWFKKEVIKLEDTKDKLQFSNSFYVLHGTKNM